jgi:hypothetical protein
MKRVKTVSPDKPKRMQETNKKIFFLSHRISYSFLLAKCKQEALQQFLEKRNRGELLVQKTSKLYEAFLAPVQLSARTYVSFDSAIQLIACDMPNIHSTATTSGPLALSVVVNEPNINRCQGIDQHCDVTCAPSTRPMVRNTFIIRKAPAKRHHQRQHCNESSEITATDSVSDCQYLKYGQDFMFECYESKQKPLMLYSTPKSPFDNHDYVFKRNGEMKQSVGLALQKVNFDGEKFGDGHDADDDSMTPSKFFHWRLFHINPEARYETIGENIPVRRIAHVALLIFYRS